MIALVHSTSMTGTFVRAPGLPGRARAEQRSSHSRLCLPALKLLRNRDAEMPCYLEVDCQLKARRLLYRQFRSAGPANDLVNVGSRKLRSGLQVLTVAEQSFVVGDVAVGMDQSQPMVLGENSDLRPQVQRRGSSGQDKRISFGAQDSLGCHIEVTGQVAFNAN